jgi:hypothetical protein
MGGTIARLLRDRTARPAHPSRASRPAAAASDRRPVVPDSPPATQRGSTVKDLGNLGELSQHGITTTKKVTTITLPTEGGARLVDDDVRRRDFLGAFHDADAAENLMRGEALWPLPLFAGSVHVAPEAKGLRSLAAIPLRAPRAYPRESARVRKKVLAAPWRALTRSAISTYTLYCSRMAAAASGWSADAFQSAGGSRSARASRPS